MNHAREMPTRFIFEGGPCDGPRNLWPHQQLDVVRLLDREHAKDHPDGPTRYADYARFGEDRYRCIGTGEVQLPRTTSG